MLILKKNFLVLPMLCPCFWRLSGSNGQQFFSVSQADASDIYHLLALVGVSQTLISVLSSHCEWRDAGGGVPSFSVSGSSSLFTWIYLHTFAYYDLLRFPYSQGRVENCPVAPQYPRGCLSSRDCLGLSASSPAALTELKLRQAAQSPLGHRAPGKHTTHGKSSPATPRTCYSLIFAPRSSNTIYTGL